MLGLVQKQFIEKYAKNPFKVAVAKASWPLLEKLLAAKFFAYVDLAVAERILKSSSTELQDSAALLGFLSLAARRGHLCVCIDDKIVPSPEDLWSSGDDQEKPSKELFEELKTLLRLGIQSIKQRTSLPICRDQNRYYLQRHWLIETQFIENLLPFLGDRQPVLMVDQSKATQLVDKMLKAGILLSEQASAIIQGCEYPFTVISGGPGTGKTYTAGVLLRTLWQCMSEEQQRSCRFALAAPTGKAAAQLEASIQRSMSDVPGFPPLKGQTLHALLNVGKRDQGIPGLLADVLLVDESSMIDASLMGTLFSAIKPGGRLILLGDGNQLPPVESGSFFADLLVGLQSNPKTKSRVTELKKCLRAELKGIIEVAEAIKQGTFPEMAKEGFKYVSWDDEVNMKEVQRQLVKQALPHFPVIQELPKNPLNVLQAFSRFRILTPLRQGPLGVETLNHLFYQEALKEVQGAPFFLAPIMISANDYRQDLFNGEIGLLVKFRDPSQTDFAYFPSRQDVSEPRQISALRLPKFEYAYCLSIHKSQGSEFEHVLMLLPEGSENFGREALYTGVTRAKKQLEIWGSQTVIKKMLERQASRQSGVKYRLA